MLASKLLLRHRASLYPAALLFARSLTGPAVAGSAALLSSVAFLTAPRVLCKPLEVGVATSGCRRNLSWNRHRLWTSVLGPQSPRRVNSRYRLFRYKYIEAIQTPRLWEREFAQPCWKWRLANRGGVIAAARGRWPNVDQPGDQSGGGSLTASERALAADHAGPYPPKRPSKEELDEELRRPLGIEELKRRLDENPYRVLFGNSSDLLDRSGPWSPHGMIQSLRGRLGRDCDEPEDNNDDALSWQRQQRQLRSSRRGRRPDTLNAISLPQPPPPPSSSFEPTLTGEPSRSGTASSSEFGIDPITMRRIPKDPAPPPATAYNMNKAVDVPVRHSSGHIIQDGDVRPPRNSAPPEPSGSQVDRQGGFPAQTNDATPATEFAPSWPDRPRDPVAAQLEKDGHESLPSDKENNSARDSGSAPLPKGNKVEDLDQLRPSDVRAAFGRNRGHAGGVYDAPYAPPRQYQEPSDEVVRQAEGKEGGGRALAQELQSIYEETYGKIDVEHRQPSVLTSGSMDSASAISQPRGATPFESDSESSSTRHNVSPQLGSYQRVPPVTSGTDASNDWRVNRQLSEYDNMLKPTLQQYRLLQGAQREGSVPSPAPSPSPSSAPASRGNGGAGRVADAQAGPDTRQASSQPRMSSSSSPRYPDAAYARLLEEKEQILQEDVQEIADFIYDVDVQLAAIARSRRERAGAIAAAIAVPPTAANKAAPAAPEAPAPTTVPAASADVVAPGAAKAHTNLPTARSAAPASPTIYKILALDPLTQQVVSASATSSTFPSPSTVPPTSNIHSASSPRNSSPTSSPSNIQPAVVEEAVSLAQIIPRLNSPARFLPYLGPLESQGFEIVSGGGDVLVFKKVREPAVVAAVAAAEPTVEPTATAAAVPIPTITTTTTTTTTAPAAAAGASPLDSARPPLRRQQPFTHGFVNPIDGTTMGNFASPTGFVSYNTVFPLEEEDEEEDGRGGGGGSAPKASQPSTAGPQTHQQPDGGPKDASATKRGGVDGDGTAAAAVRANNTLRTAAIADAARDALGAGNKAAGSATSTKTTAAAAAAATMSAAVNATNAATNAPSSPAQAYGREAAPGEARVKSSSSSSSAYAKGKKMPLARRMVFVGAWVAACSYAVGVVADFFTTGGSNGAGIQGF